MTTWFDRAPEPVPYEQRLSFWHRTKARLEERRRERQEQEARENQPIGEWAGIGNEVHSHFSRFATLPSFPMPDVDIETGFDEEDRRRTKEYLERKYGSSPVSSARRTRQVQRLETIDVDEVFWDIASMIDAHRNGATALDRPDYVEEVADDPVWQELTSRKWDPTHEMGPRERDWIRKQAKR